MDLKMLLTARGASLRVKGKIYRACVQRVLVYGSETWRVFRGCSCMEVKLGR